ncbi:macrolide family glycosyltransferase [Actinophytocola oryzae]|uniref:MGT family glycosyltransferase n=1 Tax=Actinophytocola oryzae TaxID=502181 RepID=A0A4R7VFY9_9PSEU|nr:macrolide family glycosyltransferase [Actinophytocola oryzae]TDV47958.1 MGT family glycosyltransferase [Actinophytocola oryzae]
MGRHALFLAIPAHGHMRPALAVAGELVSRGWRVSVLATDEFAGMVTAAGADVVPYTTQMSQWLGPGRAGNADPDADSLAWSRVLFFIEGAHLVEKARERFDDDPPDVVVYDMAVAHAGRALGQLWHRPTIQSTPSFGSNARYSQVDVVLASAGVGPGHPALAELRRMAGEFAARYDLADAPDDLVSWAADHAIVYLPRQFQVASAGFGDGVGFVGPCLGTEDRAGDWAPPPDGRPVVVVSMGTTVNGGVELFRQCRDAFADQPWHVVMTLGGTDPAALGAIPTNIEVRAWIPQLAVLGHAAVFVTSGGLGSVAMALHEGVPMVVVPRIPECRVIARRVAALGLGTVVPPGEATGPRLRDAVAALLADGDTARRVAAMREHTRAAGGATAAAALVEARSAVHAGG